MRNPLWMLTISLAIIFFAMIIILFFTRARPPKRTSLTLQPIRSAERKGTTDIDIRRIYENDLFKSYVKPAEPPQEEKLELQVPEPPALKFSPPPPPPQIQFFEPLKLTLKGVISSTDEHGNRAIIADDRTGKEDVYKVGDSIEDAEIITIERTKVIFIRSNGQQETVFLNVREAAADHIFSRQFSSWQDVVQKTSEYAYVVDPTRLKERFDSMAQFIDMLDMTTAFENGVAIGCRIGRLAQESIGNTLGLRYGDIIVSINDVSVATPQERVRAYGNIKDLPSGSTIRIRLERNKQERTLLVTLGSLAQMGTEGNALYQGQDVGISSHVPSYIQEMKNKEMATWNTYRNQAALLSR